MLHSLNSFCNNCLNYTIIDKRLHARNLHPHVFQICRRMKMHPTRIDLEKDTLKVSLATQATLNVFPNKEQAELFIPKDSIPNWEDIQKGLQNQEAFNSKEAIHDAIAKHEGRPIRINHARIVKDTGDVEISAYDSLYDKKNELKGIRITREGIHLDYKQDIPYDLYKAFNMSFYKY